MLFQDFFNYDDDKVTTKPTRSKDGNSFSKLMQHLRETWNHFVVVAVGNHCGLNYNLPPPVMTIKQEEVTTIKPTTQTMVAIEASTTTKPVNATNPEMPDPKPDPGSKDPNEITSPNPDPNPNPFRGWMWMSTINKVNSRKQRFVVQVLWIACRELAVSNCATWQSSINNRFRSQQSIKCKCLGINPKTSADRVLLLPWKWNLIHRKTRKFHLPKTRKGKQFAMGKWWRHVDEGKGSASLPSFLVMNVRGSRWMETLQER